MKIERKKDLLAEEVNRVMQNRLAVSRTSRLTGSAMDEELIEEINDTLRLVFMAGRKIRRVEDLERFERTMALALSEGWDAEGDEDVDYMVGLM